MPTSGAEVLVISRLCVYVFVNTCYREVNLQLETV